MRAVAVCLAMMVVVPVAVAWAADTQIVVVLDCSTSMWQRLDDGTPRFAAARLAIESLATTLSPKDGARLALRLMGSDTRFTDDSACEDTRLVFSPGISVQGAIADSIGLLKPVGARPLILATVRAAADLAGLDGRHKLVLVTAGDDGCFGDRRRAAAALDDGVEVRIVGVGLDQDIERHFTAVAPTRNATNTAELAAALLWAVYGPEPPAKRHDVSIAAVRDQEPADVRELIVSDAITGATIEMKSRDQHFEARVSSGIYDATVTDNRGASYEFGHISVSGIGANTYRLQVADEPAVTLEVTQDPSMAGGDIMVHYWGAPEGQHWVEVGTSGGRLGSWTDRALAFGPAGDVLLQAPVDVGPSEVRFLERQTDGVVRMIGRTPVEIEAPQVSLHVPESVVLGSEFSIEWQGPDHEGDHLVIVPARRGLATPVACSFTGARNSTTFAAPSEEGVFAVHYVSGLTAQSLATVEFVVTHTPVELRAPDRVPIGGTIVVEWDGPDRVGDSVTLAVPDSPGDEYLSLQPTSSGSPALLTAPRRPGTYEIRYIRNLDAAVEGSKSIEVFDVPVRLTVPARVKAGTRFEVTWQGPDSTDDFISIAPPGSQWKRKIDWAYTATGNPTSLAAPYASGSYEVRYVSASDSKILGAVPITVE